MATIPEIRSEETEMILPINHTTMPSKNLTAEHIISNMRTPVIIDPIDPKRISEKPTNCLTKSSLVKAGLVFLGTVGAYYLSKTTGVFSYFGWGYKNTNSKDVNSEIMKVKNRENSLAVKTNLETARQTNNPSINRIAQTYKTEGRTIEFKEIEVEEFKNLQRKKNLLDERSSARRSINIQNPIPNQNATVEKLFELTIDGSSVFSSSSALFLEAAYIPSWLTSYCNPTFKGSYDPYGNSVSDVALSGNYAYVAGGRADLQIIDISDPSNPSFKGSYDTTSGIAEDVALFGNYAYVADRTLGLQIIDITDPANPTFKGSYNTPGYASLGVAISGNYAYVADFDGGLQIIDISDTSNPTFKGSYDTLFGGFHDVTLSGNYAYVAGGVGGLQIIDITDPSNPTFKGSYDMGEFTTWTEGVAVSGNYAYVVGNGFYIIDISDPSNPILKGSYDMPNFSGGVAHSGNYAYVADRTLGLQIIDIRDPSNPTFKGSYDTLDYAHGVALSGNYAYVAHMELISRLVMKKWNV
jgi:hypothetical protein